MSVPTHQQDLIALLEERGFVHQCTDRDGLAAPLPAGPATHHLALHPPPAHPPPPPPPPPPP
ncbi:hypothetical protein NAG16_02210, partial [Pseudomonas aeruginosa]|nr:hypothetical protein [Pseudomonas aeruginosa]